MILRVLGVLSRPSRQGIGAIALPATAFACVAALIAIVVGGAQTFWGYSDEFAGFYQGCAVIALVLLTVPLVSLGAAAARLSARRRDDRLAALRLLGASGPATASIAVLEAALVAVAGSAVGVVLALAATPLVGLIPFRGEPLGTTGVLLPIWAYPAIAGAIAVVAAVSAATSLRRVVISPLGVALRQQPPRIPWVPAVIAIVGIALASFVMGNLGAFGGAVAIVAALGVALTVTLFAIDVIGAWIVGLTARRRARRAQTPERLLAARAILESPRAAWRQVSGVAMSSFMAVFAGSGVAFMGAIEGSISTTGPEAHIVADLRTGILVTVVGTFIMVACAVGVNQAAQILDRRDIARALAVMGAPLEVQDRARRRALTQPLLLAALGSAAAAAVVVLPLVGVTLVIAPLSLAVIAGALALGIGTVLAALPLTRPLLRSVASTG